MSEALVLRTALGKYDYLKPLRDGRVTSKRVRFDFHDFDAMPKAFRLMVRGGDLDVSEMAVVTHLMAHRYNKPLVGLAIPLWGRLPHTNLVCNADSDVKNPSDLNGRKVGVRAYAQTSGVWVRGLLETEYGVDLDSITWLTMEDSHLAEYVDPENTVRNTSDQGLRDMMISGELAAIMGERIVSPSGIRTVIPDAENVASGWVAKKGLSPINHTLVVRSELHEANPWLAQELMELFTEARQIAISEDGINPPEEYGLEANRASIQLLLDFSARQKISERRYEADELYLPL